LALKLDVTGARGAVGRQRGGVGGLAGRGMWRGGGRAPAPAARESGEGGQQSGGAGGREVGRERRRGRRVGTASGGTRWHGEEGEAAGWDWLQREREPTDRRAWSRKSKFKTDSNSTLSKTGVPGLKKSKIKYGYEGFK
jgi:hypothetical protein